MATSIAIRLGVEGGAELKRVLDDAGTAGQAASQKVGAAADQAAAATDRQTAKWQRLAQAAREAAACCTSPRARTARSSPMQMGAGRRGCPASTGTSPWWSARVPPEMKVIALDSVFDASARRHILVPPRASVADMVWAAYPGLPMALRRDIIVASIDNIEVPVEAGTVHRIWATSSDNDAPPNESAPVGPVNATVG